MSCDVIPMPGAKAPPLRRTPDTLTPEQLAAVLDLAAHALCVYELWHRAEGFDRNPQVLLPKTRGHKKQPLEAMGLQDDQAFRVLRLSMLDLYKCEVRSRIAAMIERNAPREAIERGLSVIMDADVPAWVWP